jgi:hypothetical protein
MKVWKVAVIAGLVVALAAGAGVVFAQGEDPNSPKDEGYCCGPREKIRRQLDGDLSIQEPPEWRDGPVMDREALHDWMQAAIAEALGMTVDELEAQMDIEGGPIGVALAQGLSLDEAQTLLEEAHRSAIQEAVAQGLIDEDQAESLLAHVRGGVPGAEPLQPRGGMAGDRIQRGSCDPTSTVE